MNTGNINKFIRFLAIVLLLSVVLSISSCYSKKTIVKTEKIVADDPYRGDAGIFCRSEKAGTGYSDNAGQNSEGAGRTRIR